MKKIFLVVAILAVSQLVTAQNSQNWNKRKLPIATDWIFGAGFNTVNNSGAGFKELTNSDHWAFGKIPFYGSVETNFANKWTAKATFRSTILKMEKSLMERPSKENRRVVTMRVMQPLIWRLSIIF